MLNRTDKSHVLIRWYFVLMYEYGVLVLTPHVQVRTNENILMS